MRRTLRLVSTLAIAAVLAIWQPATTVATDPGSANPPVTVPPRDPDGPVRLPTGRLLPVAPPGALGQSAMADALRSHANDRIRFQPGNRPLALGKPQASTSSATTGTASDASLIPLAPAIHPPAVVAVASGLPNGLRKEVLGFLPYWELDASSLQWMRYDRVSTIAYFGVAARSNGTLATTSGGVTTTTWAGWNSSAMTSVINAAHARGDRVVLTITMMAWDSASASGQATLLGSATYRQALINNIIATLRARNADGVNLDFEPLSTTLRSQYTSFVRQLKAALVAAGVGSYLTVCTMAGAATWATGYDIAGLTAAGAADDLFVMGYDYSGSWSSRAGGIAPMTSSYMLDVNESVNDYLSLTSGSKLIWGVPYYGEVWQTSSNALNASTVSGGYFAAFYYTAMKSKAAQYGRKWDALGQGPWFSYQSGGAWYEGYYDDVQSLSAKYDMVNQRGLAGIGIWHLQMDQGTSELWDLLANRFQADTIPPTGGVSVLPSVVDAYAYQVHWNAVDVGSGIASYNVQVRDRASSTWGYWLINSTATSATFMGYPGHAYEFRVSARDALGNSQPWVAAYADAGAAAAVGGFAQVSVPTLNVRAGAGTTFSTIAQLAAGSLVAVLSGPVPASGYDWYQVQFSFSEWPSAAYPRTGWVAAGDASGAYLRAAQPPTSTVFAPQVSSYALLTPTFSPNGDGNGDGVSVGYALAQSASVRLEVRDGTGSLVQTQDLGSSGPGSHTATWDGRTPNGWAPAGRYLVTVVATDGNGTHVAPAQFADSATLGRWGVTADLTPPTPTAWLPTGSGVSTAANVAVTFSEPVTGVGTGTLVLVDWTTKSAVPATVSYNSSSRVATLDPASALVAGRTYRVWLSSAIRDLAGNPLASMSWPFTTAGAP